MNIPRKEESCYSLQDEKRDTDESEEGGSEGVWRRRGGRLEWESGEQTPSQVDTVAGECRQDLLMLIST